MTERTAVYECVCGKWSRTAMKFLEEGQIPVCYACGRIMQLKFKDLEKLDETRMFVTPEICKPINPEKAAKRRVAGTGRPRKEKDITQREKRLKEAQERRESGEVRGRKPGQKVEGYRHWKK